MVRFSDMLGGDGDPKDARAATVPAPSIADAIPEPEPETDLDGVDGTTADSTVESPQDVLERLTQYATSTRSVEATPPDAERPPAAETPPPETSPAAPPAPTGLEPVGDDFLPRGKKETRKPSRRNKRRP